MGKKDKKKKGLGKAKTEAREAKKSEKARRRNIAEAGDDDVEAILAGILAKEAEQIAVTTVPDAPAPSARAAFTMVVLPVSTDPAELLFFGGERYNGDRAHFFNDTYVYHVDKRAWTRYDSPTRPPPRSGHAMCVHRNFVYMFGGEFSNPSLSQYRHYRDLWRLDAEDMSWEKLDIRGGPSARSGHRMAVVKSKLLVFGGYVDTGFGENKYLNDMYYIDLAADEYVWKKVETSAVDIVPSPRSGFQWAVFGDEVLLYGGYCREAASKSKTVSHKGTKKGGGVAEEAMAARGIVHSDMFRLNGDTLKWQKVKRNGYGPSSRSGFSLVIHKRAFVVFGGVEDNETEEDLESTFYQDLFGFNVDRKKWYPMTVRKRGQKGKRGRRRRRMDNQESRVGSQEQNETASAVATRISEGGKNWEDTAKEDVDVGEDEDEDEDVEVDAAAMEAEIKKEQEEELAPCGRFNACAAVLRNILYICGGVLEKNERDITLDDMWSVDLNKLDEFHQVKPLSQEALEWVESDDGDGDGDDDEESAGPAEDNDDDGDGASDEVDEQQRRIQRTKRLREKVAQSEDVMMPRVLESLKDYFDRSKAHWIGEVHEALGESGKGLRRVAFEWAYKRYWEVKPTLKELEDLEEELAEEARLEDVFQKSQIDQRRGRSRR